jgi:hypothetical protein
MSDHARIELDGQAFEAPLIIGTENEKAFDVSNLRKEAGYITYDPGYANTGSVKSDITFIDGEEGVLRYRGYPIEELAERSDFIETAYMLIYGDLPNQAELDHFRESITRHTLLRELDLAEADAINFAAMNAQVIRPSAQGINPYFIGLKIFEALEQQYGQAFLFEVREMHNDLSFLGNYLTKDIIEQMDLYLYGKKDDKYFITTKEWEKIKAKMLHQRVNGGFPYLVVLDGDYNNNGELYIRHQHEGTDLDRHYVKKTLPYVRFLWGKPVHLETVRKGKMKRYTCTKENEVLVS